MFLKLYKLLPEAAVLLIGAGNEVCRQLRDIISWGVTKFLWIQNEQLGQKFIGEEGETEPEAQSSWDPSQIILFANNIEVNHLIQVYVFFFLVLGQSIRHFFIFYL